MTSSSSFSSLPVPPRAIEGVGMLACETLPNVEEWARAISAPVVAAELRRLAEDMWCMNGHEIALRNRADELDGGES